MDVVTYAEHMYKVLGEREEQLKNALANDSPKNWEQYKMMVGEIRGIAFARMEFKALLEKNADDAENIIRS